MSKTVYKRRRRHLSRKRQSMQRNNRNNTVIRGGSSSEEREIERLKRKLQPATKRSPLRFLRENGYLGEGRKIAAANKKKSQDAMLKDLQDHVEIKKGVGQISDAVDRIRRGDYSGMRDISAGINRVGGPINRKYSAEEGSVNRKILEMDAKSGAIGDAFDSFSFSSPHVSNDEIDRVIAKLQVDMLPPAGKKKVPLRR